MNADVAPAATAAAAATPAMRALVADEVFPGAQIVAACRRLLAGHLRDELPPESAATHFHLPAFARLEVGLRRRGALRALKSGSGASAEAQLADAVARACADARQGRVVAAELADLDVEVWLQTGEEVIALGEREFAGDLLLGRCGVEVEWADARADFKPSVALEQSFKRPAELLDALCEKAGLFPGAWREPACSVRRIHWRHLCGGVDGGYAELRGLRPLDAYTPSAASLRDWIDEGLGYLASNQQSDGDYCYLFYPLRGRGGAETSNTVRSSGCAYAMAQAVQACAPALRAIALRSAMRAIAGILARCAPGPDGGLIVPELGAAAPGTGKLGSTALLALATLAPALRERYAAQTPRLLASLLSAQDEDGRLRCYFGSDREAGVVVDYYPGEALLALAHAAELGVPGCMDACRRAFAPYRAHFNAAPASAFVGWHVDVWSRMARLDDAHDYASFAFEQIDWLLPQQQLADPLAEDYGGFRIGGARANVSSTVYAEATTRAAALARDLGDAARWQRYRDAALAALRFCAGLRMRREQAALFPQPERTIGGVTGNGVRFEVRADHVQHLMTMAIAALQTRELLPAA